MRYMLLPDPDACIRDRIDYIDDIPDPVSALYGKVHGSLLGIFDRIVKKIQ